MKLTDLRGIGVEDDARVAGLARRLSRAIAPPLDRGVDEGPRDHGAIASQLGGRAGAPQVDSSDPRRVQTQGNRVSKSPRASILAPRRPAMPIMRA